MTVMPCFDKKLEAARPELLTDGVLYAALPRHGLLSAVYLAI